MCKCSNCFAEKETLVLLPMYGYLCPNCYQQIIQDYLK